MSSSTRTQLEAWLKTIEVVGGRVLDIGSSQKNLKGRLKILQADEIVGLDLPNPHEGAPTDIACDIQEGSLQLAEAGKFDTAFCIEVSEYWTRPHEALQNIWDCLKDDGLLYISFALCYPIHKPHGTDMLRYTGDGAEKLLDEAGFKIISNVPRVAENPIMLRQAYAAERMRWASESSVDQTGYMLTARKCARTVGSA